MRPTTARDLHRWDRYGWGSLIVLPFLVFLIPAATGHVLAPGDDLTQNLPLRMLVGSDLRHGHLPLWDPDIWSGTPLLAGFNAGALYPATLLFSFLPTAWAWGLGEAATYVLAGTGVYLLARRQALGPLPAWLAGFSFTWSGFMLAQLRHIGLVEGMAWAAWCLLGLDHLSRPGSSVGWRRAVGWAALSGLAGGMTCLAGDPRAVSNLAEAVVVYGLWAFWRRPAGRLRLVAGALGAGVLTVLLAAGQYLPGLAAQSLSQRAGVSLSAFGAGSLHPAYTLFLDMPFLTGGFGTLGLPSFSGSYNIPEVTGYIGMLGLAGALAALGGALGRRRTPDGARVGPAVWGVMAVVGLALAYGTDTPLGHLLVHIPLYSGERLQSRNLGEVDLALALLFGLWAQSFLTGPAGSSGHGLHGAGPAGPGLHGARARRWSLAAGLAVPATVAAVLVLCLVRPDSMAHWMGSQVRLLPRDWPFFIASLVLAGAVAAVLVVGPRLPAAARARLVVGVTVVDVAFFAVNGLSQWTDTSYFDSLTHGSPALAAALPAGTRYAVYDPQAHYSAYNQGDANLVPVPDLNVIGGIPSVQGYGSLVADSYESATGTHARGGMNLSVLKAPLAGELDLGLVLLDPGDDLTAVDAALTSAGWVRAGTIDGLLAWRNPKPPPAAQAVPLTTGGVKGGASPTGGTAGTSRQASPTGGTAGASRQATVSCSVPNPVGGGTDCAVESSGPVRLERSEAWAPGWVALVRHDGGRARVVPTFDHDLVQSVDLAGAGQWQVSFRYRPPRDFLGIVLSGIGLVAGLLGLLGLRPSRRRRRPAG